MFIRYNPVAKYYEYSTDITRRGKGPWLILPIDYTQIYNLPPIPPPYVLPANVALRDAFNQFTALNYFQGRIVLFGGTGTGYADGPFEIQRAQNPRVSFHWPGVVASQIGMDSSGVIRTWDNPGTGYERFAAGAITANGNITAAGNIHNTAGFVFPGQAHNGGLYQGSWYLASHPSYGLFSNTGLLLSGEFWSQNHIFPDAQISNSYPNVLDDYEEGGWTPYFSSSGGGSSTYSIQNGSYTKIGNVVTFTFDLGIASYGFAEGIASINLPFVSSGYYGIGSVGYFGIQNPVGWFSILIGPSGSYADFRFTGGGGAPGTAQLYIGNIGPGGRIIGGGTYRTPT